jgi:hypothetical protein
MDMDRYGLLPSLVSLTSSLAYFANFKKMKVGLCNLHAVCVTFVSVNAFRSLLTLECLDQSLQNLVSPNNP